jgi:hypothetical protein
MTDQYTGGTGVHSVGDYTYHSGMIMNCPICNPKARWKCPQCGGWVSTDVGTHYCPSVSPYTPLDRTAGCPCSTENGGSGVCGCISGVIA